MNFTRPQTDNTVRLAMQKRRGDRLVVEQAILAFHVNNLMQSVEI